MSIRSLLTLGLLAAPAVLASPQPYGEKTKTVTEYKTKTETETKYKTVIKTQFNSCSSAVSSSLGTSSSSSSATTATATSTVSASGTNTVVSSSTTSSAAASMTTTLTATHTGTSGLNDYAKATGKLYMGTAADLPNIGDSAAGEATDEYYLAEFNNTHDFGASTPANIMKWEFIEPEQGVFNFTGGDEFIALSKASGKLVRCHNLNWYNQNPAWLTNGNWTNATILEALVHHINETVTHFGDDCYAWDVVNEALNDNGLLDQPYREDIWYNITGTSYIYTAFAAAEAAVKAGGFSTKLYYNDYSIENPGNKSTAAQNIVAELNARGIQIDGVGLQSHFIVGETPTTAQQMENMNAFVALDVDVAVTELDVRTTTPATLEAQQQQVLDYASTIAACAGVERCVGVTLWDFDDTYSWIPSTFAGQGYGDVWFQPNGSDTPLVTKAAYDGIVDGWTGVVPTLGDTK